MLLATSTSQNRPPPDHPPTAPKQKPATGHRCQAQAPHEEQLQLPNTGPHLVPSCCNPQWSPSLPWTEVWPRVIVAKSRPRCTSSNFRLQDPWPRINQAPRSKAQPPKETSKPRQKSKCDAFEKRATPMTPPSQDFYPWMKELEGTTMPPKKPSSRSSANKLGLHPTSTAVTVVPPLCTCSSEGLQRSVTPSDQTTHRAGHGSAACITSPYVESVEDH